MLNGNRRDLNLTVNATFVEIDDLTKNDNLEFFIFIEYEGVNSTQMSLQFRHNKGKIIHEQQITKWPLFAWLEDT